jgi:hypothetical protein
MWAAADAIEHLMLGLSQQEAAAVAMVMLLSVATVTPPMSGRRDHGRYQRVRAPG